MNSNGLDMANLIEGFRLSCQTEGKSPKTIEWYSGFLNSFRLFLESNSMPTDASGIEKSHIKAFILYLQTEGLQKHLVLET